MSPGVDDDGNGEAARHLLDARLVDGRPDLGQVLAVDSGRMQVDDVCAAGDDGLEKQVGRACRDGPPLAARKAAVEVAAVRQVARLVQEAEQVDDGHEHERAAQAVQRSQRAQATDNFDAVELVAVDPRAHEEHGALPAAVDHLHGHVQRRLGIQLRHGQFELQTLAASHAAGRRSRTAPAALSHGAARTPRRRRRSAPPASA